MGANQNNHSCASAQPPTNNAGPVLRAGFTEVLVTGMLIKWISVSTRPIGIGAKPCGTRLSVAPIMSNRKTAVIVISQTRHETRAYPPGECAPYPLVANPALKLKLGMPLAITYKTDEAKIAPSTCTTIYGITSLAGKLPPAAKPTVTAGLMWHPLMWPIA